ncbi:hypothetical protein MIND_01374400 [Mycena indigotica]|uniref:Uncharacterized protein n=1 Tax=Mycena indigotica TaxID=2126181 RepID=A0A8H6VUW4_9AGAR|nr:uncharacterized protein MIND_01374400 [Mycena indigotica]KAF7289134.1 hypothetical protein MIND_01374400 [Mycena indigotica]
MRVWRRRLPAGASARSLDELSSPLAATIDNFHTSLEVMKDAVEGCPPLKCSLAIVVGLWNLSDRANESRLQARALAFKAAEMVDAMYRSIGPSPPPLSDSVIAHILILTTTYL